MSFNHSVSDLVARIKNGCMIKRSTISTPSSKLREGILQILKDEGYISGYAKTKDSSFDKIEVSLKYKNATPVINELQVVSKPGRRIYCSAKEIPLVKNGLGMVVISTSQGILPDYKARAQNLGGEVLFKIF